MKYKRSERMIDMTYYLLEHPHTLIPLTLFSERYEAAKSSISEDLTIIKGTFKEQHIGLIETVPGATGGVRYIPQVSEKDAEEFILWLCEKLSDSERLLPGGYVFLSDLLGSPEVLKPLGKIIASQFIDQKVDAVMTVATKGIPIAQTVANYLNVPFVIVRKDSKITEGATVSVNYVSGSSQRVEKMELSRRSLKKGARVVIVDDFMKGGGTLNGMRSLIEEFEAELVGATVFAESVFHGKRAVHNYRSLLLIEDVSVADKTIQVKPGNFLQKEPE
ncbi:pur operon repressor [Lacticigenium naphthae]|uniref:pur operon repressor n=1 Tax=Lacticigenium naphthae TaxID=515351 RepID=UPI000412D292|nr:pur operon repressor [Lacticigenium naphthae]